MREKEELPAWMYEEEIYTPVGDKDGFVIKSILSVMGVLGRIQLNGTSKTVGANTPLKLVYTLLFIILTACSRNMLFTWIMMAGILVRLCLLSGKELVSVCKASVSAALFSALLLVPAVFLGSPHTLLTVSCKVWISVSLMDLLAHTSKWNELTGSLRFFYVPDLFIFTFDLTLKYIVMLGKVCLNMLQALQMRSVGKNNRKGQSISGVLGVTFLKSKELSEEMYGAMCCRGFEGEYYRQKKIQWKKMDLLYVLLIVSVIVLFIYLEGVMR